MDRLRVVTLDIWNRLGPWDDRKRLIRKGVERWVPDRMGLQEVLRLEVPPEPPGVRPSDHFGVPADLSVGRSPRPPAGSDPSGAPS